MLKKTRDNKLKIIFMIVFLMSLSLPVYAQTVETSKIFTGLKKLLEDIGKALIVIAPIAGTAVIAYCFIRRAAADEMDHKKWTNRINTALVSTIGALVAGVIITVISSYFQ